MGEAKQRDTFRQSEKDHFSLITHTQTLWDENKDLEFFLNHLTAALQLLPNTRQPGLPVSARPCSAKAASVGV